MIINEKLNELKKKPLTFFNELFDYGKNNLQGCAKKLGISKSVLYHTAKKAGYDFKKYKERFFLKHPKKQKKVVKMSRADFVKKYCKSGKCWIDTSNKNSYWKPDGCFVLGCVMFPENKKQLYNNEKDICILEV